ncbi:PREDICTED: uncharacterized protein LOC104590506 [Nelumbo nucifera]|uniref:Uncharacterized protein LOC104590506 n=1 Tax=Nelumbo nucifera TaxID=4432 RepID=A0A1U7Z2X2_NELNU|nr:PREDICTED: uncharacterized protein LOC104590506 [Nelumbo nucifera]
MASEINLKLLVDMNTNKVLFAEAGKELVDFVFHLLSLPMGSIMRLLIPLSSSNGCFGNLYNSVDNLHEMYIQANTDKALLLQPEIASSTSSGFGQEIVLLQPQSGIRANPLPKLKFYRCPRTCGTVTNVMFTRCTCGYEMSSEMQLIEPAVAATPTRRGYVKEVVTYMITDDLEISPISTVSTIALLSKFGINGIDALEEMVVELGRDEGLALLRASLQPKSVLTKVFQGEISKRSRLSVPSNPRSTSDKNSEAVQTASNDRKVQTEDIQISVVDGEK